jgi:hypothetical protein
MAYKIKLPPPMGKAATTVAPNYVRAFKIRVMVSSASGTTTPAPTQGQIWPRRQ